MDFRQLEYFEAVVKAGSFSQAARVLNMTQPPLSAAIAKLERDAGVQLLVRSAKGVFPTKAGRYLLNQVAQLITSRDRVARGLKLLGQGLIGELRIGAEPMVIYELVAGALSEFARIAPAAQLVLSDESPRFVLEGVASGELDVGCIPFAPERIARPIADRYEWVPLGGIDLKIAVPRARAGEFHSDGRGWGRWIVPARLPGMIDQLEAELSGDPSFETLFVSTPLTAIPLVAAGLGVAPSTHAIGSTHPGVALINPPEWMAPMHMSMMMRKGGEASSLLERWLVHACARAGVMPPERPQLGFE